MPGIRPRIAPTQSYGIVGTNIYSDIVDGATQLMGIVQRGQQNRAQNEFRREELNLQKDKFKEQKKDQQYRNQLVQAQAKALEQKQADDVKSDRAAKQAGTAMKLFNAGEALISDAVPSAQQTADDTKLINDQLGGIFDEGGLSIQSTEGGYNLVADDAETLDMFRAAFGADLGAFGGQVVEGKDAEGNVTSKFTGQTITGVELGALGRSIVGNMDRSDNPAAYDKAFGAMDSSITDPEKRASTARDLYSTSQTRMVKNYENSLDDFKKDVRNAGMSPEMMAAGLDEITRRHEMALSTARDAYDKADDKLQGAYDFQSTYHIQNVQTQRMINEFNDLGRFIRDEDSNAPAFATHAASYQKFVVQKKGEAISWPSSDRVTLYNAMEKDLDGTVFPKLYAILEGNGSATEYSESDMADTAQSMKVKLEAAIMDPTAARPKLNAKESRLYNAAGTYLQPYFGTFPVMTNDEVSTHEATIKKGGLPSALQKVVEQSTATE